MPPADEARAPHCSRIGFTKRPHDKQDLLKLQRYCVVLRQKGMTMRTMTAAALVAIVSLGMPAFVQAQGASSQNDNAPAQSSDAPAESSVTIHSIEVIDIKELPPAVKSQVDDIVAKTSEEDKQSLRKSIDGTPAAVSALKAKGLSSSQVVAINIADGVLMLFTKTA